MLSPEVMLLGAAAAALGLFVWIVAVGRDRPAFAKFADEKGWDHRSAAPAEAGSLGQHVAEGRREGERLGVWFAGPSAAGPFQMMAIRSVGGSRAGGAWEGDRTLVHIRTSAEAPHVRFGPAGRFHIKDEKDAAPLVDHPGFRRRYDVVSDDDEFTRHALDWETCAILTEPAKGVVVDWRGRDFLVVFPVQPRTAAGFETLVRFASGLALRMQRPLGARRAAPGAMDMPAPDRSGAPAAA